MYKDQYSEFFFEYHRLGGKAFREKVRFYESNRNMFHLLSYEERTELDIDYCICLFEIGKYHKFLTLVDSLIELTITENIYQYNNIPIFEDLLFKKAACLYNTGQYIKSEKVLKSLIKIDPKHDVAKKLFARCKRKQVRNWYEGAKAIAMMLLISALSISFMQLLIVKPFYQDYLAPFQTLKLVFIGIALAILGVKELILYYIIQKEIGSKKKFFNPWF